MTVLAATAESINTAFAQMGTQLDLCAILQDAQAMGVHLAATKGTFQQYPSMILGVNEIAPLTMASAYAGFAAGGVVCTPVAVEKIVDPSGAERPFTPSACHQAIAPNIANTVQYALQSVLRPPGTAASANPNDGVPMFAKTGTTDGDTQNWLISSTTNYTNAIWIGNVKGQVGLENVPLGGGATGYDAKFDVGRTLFPVLDAALGGGALPAPDPALVGTPAKSAPKTKAAPAPAAPQPAAPAAPQPAAPQPQQPNPGHGRGHGGNH
jgi:membrane peptidoglycan carboxypeptidase